MSIRVPDRRFTPRMDLRLPIRFHPFSTFDVPEEAAETVNISRRGVYFSTSLPASKGMQVELKFTMPEEVSGKPERAWRCVGRVVRIDKNEGRWGRCGIGIEFDYYELVSLARTA